MDPRLLKTIRGYQGCVAWAVGKLEQAGIPRPESNTAWTRNGVPQLGALPEGIDYFKHGHGCAVHDRNGTVDFDFGVEGEIHGFDEWRLWEFLKSGPERFGFHSEDQLGVAFERAVADGELRFSGYILYYLNENMLPSEREGTGQHRIR